jgi:hypothetical protein
LAKLADAVNSADFAARLNATMAAPAGKVARGVVAEVLKFVTLACDHVPWTTEEHNAELLNLFAAQRALSPSSVFSTIAPNNMHDAIRWDVPYVWSGEYHAVGLAQGTFSMVLWGQTAEERTAGWHRMDVGALQQLAC